MKKVLIIKVEEDYPPFYVTCSICKCKPVLVHIDVPLHRKLYMGRCDCAIYYWCGEALPIDYYSRYMYFSTVAGVDGFTKTYNGASKVYRPPTLTDSPNALILETVDIFDNPFCTYGSGRSKYYYRHYFYNELRINPRFRNSVLELEGKRLFCPHKFHHSYTIRDWFMAGCPGGFCETT